MKFTYLNANDMETPQDYIIGLGKRYIKGKVSSQMLIKHFECTFNWYEFEMSKLTGFNKIPYAIAMAISLNSACISIYQNNRPKPKYKRGGIDLPGQSHSNEFILMPNKKQLTITEIPVIKSK